MTSKEFQELARSKPHAIPVKAELVLDAETPVSAFHKLRGPETDQRCAFLLESMEGGEIWGRYSLLGYGTRARFEVRGRTVRIEEHGEPGVPRTAITKATDDPLSELKALLSAHRPAEVPGLPRFSGGAVGYLGYDIVRRFERLPEHADDDLGLPEAQLMIPETTVVFDHRNHTVTVVHNAVLTGDPAEDYERAILSLDRTVSLLTAPAREQLNPLPAVTADTRAQISPFPFQSAMGERRFCAAVEQIRELIHSGEAIQVVLSHRLARSFDGDPFDTYRALRIINPSPYMFYLDLGPLQIAGASPEVLVRVTEGEVTVRPIAGTRPRGATDREDRELEASLRSDAKERAEHLMLVDLGRNDVGRVSDFGSVVVEESAAIERYSHVMHLVSAVRGRLRPGLDAFDSLRACFPAGTVSGAPKVRAMEIIEELEPTRRGIYAGAVGYFDFRGDVDQAIAIRTLVCYGGKAYVQVGAGIVADSVPEREFEETMAKGRALFRAVEMAEETRTMSMRALSTRS